MCWRHHWRVDALALQEYAGRVDQVHGANPRLLPMTLLRLTGCVWRSRRGIENTPRAAAQRDRQVRLRRRGRPRRGKPAHAGTAGGGWTGPGGESKTKETTYQAVGDVERGSR